MTAKDGIITNETIDFQQLSAAIVSKLQGQEAEIAKLKKRVAELEEELNKRNIENSRS